MIRSFSAFILLFTPIEAFAADDELVATKTPTTVEFRAGKEVVTVYQYAGEVQLEKGDGKKLLAKPFFYPLNAPNGVQVTRGWPMVRGTAGEKTDHYHQKSVWFCHGDVIPEGLELKVKSSDKRVHGVDFWSETTGHGRIVCTDVGEPKAVSKSHASVTTRNAWQAPNGTAILEETRTLHVMMLPAGRLLIFDIDLHAAVCPITFGDTKEGSMGVRVNDSFRLEIKEGGTITSSQGGVAKAMAKDNLPMWGEIAEWHDYTGLIDGKTAGITIFDHPTNANKAAWHTRAYGLMAANPFGRAGAGFPAWKGKPELVKMAKGDHLKLKYGVYAHSGDATEGKVAEVYQQFAAMK